MTAPAPLTPRDAFEEAAKIADAKAFGGSNSYDHACRNIAAALRARAAELPAQDDGWRATLQAIRQRSVQAIGAGLSTRNWHATETAYNELRDAVDRLLANLPSPPTGAA